MTSVKDSSGQYITTALHIHESYHFYALIPDFEVRTDEARAILPDSYSKAVTVSNSAKAIMLCQSIQNGDIALLKEAGNDMIHEPYRRKLIHGYDQVRAMMEEKTGGVFLISGSGSTCLLITHNILDDLNDLYIDGHTWQIREIRPAMKGTYAER
jgi:homoserine kinase